MGQEAEPLLGTLPRPLPQARAPPVEDDPTSPRYSHHCPAHQLEGLREVRAGKGLGREPSGLD